MSSKGPFIMDFVEGDLLPHLDVEWEGVDITGYSIKLNIRRPNGTKVTIDAVLDDLNVGGAGSAIFHFEWSPGDLIVGESDAEIEVFDAASNNETWQGLVLRVSEEIA